MNIFYVYIYTTYLYIFLYYIFLYIWQIFYWNMSRINANSLAVMRMDLGEFEIGKSTSASSLVARWASSGYRHGIYTIFIGAYYPWLSEWKIIGRRAYDADYRLSACRQIFALFAIGATVSTDHLQRTLAFNCRDVREWEWENRSINPIKFCYAIVGSSSNSNDMATMVTTAWHPPNCILCANVDLEFARSSFSFRELKKILFHVW